MSTSPPVVFDFSIWSAIYPEFANVSAPQAQGFFDRACLMMANRLGPVCDVNQLTALLYLLTAHIAFLSTRGAGPGGAGLVGRITSATEGSVSVSTEWAGGGSPTEAWYLQSQYGAEFWIATAQFRSAVYVRSPFPSAAAFPYGGGFYGSRRGGGFN